MLYLRREDCPKCGDTAFVIDGEINCGCGCRVNDYIDPLELAYKRYIEKKKNKERIKIGDIIYKLYCKECKRKFYTVKEKKKFCEITCREKYWQRNNSRTYRECLHCRKEFKIKRTKHFVCSKRCLIAHLKPSEFDLLDRYLKSIPVPSITFIRNE